ncbi:MAG: ATP:cob(I)alamin adenosyltransferase [Planctomycetes bacterium]|nr:ATP:cob(I)alamin adenosyltransferase [Planctomycetota bacterium]
MEKSKVKIPLISEEDIVLLENAIDEWAGVLPEMRSFILPGGHPIVSHIHIARCVCRRAERAGTPTVASRAIEAATAMNCDIVNEERGR